MTSLIWRLKHSHNKIPTATKTARAAPTAIPAIAPELKLYVSAETSESSHRLLLEDPLEDPLDDPSDDPLDKGWRLWIGVVRGESAFMQVLFVV